MVWKYDGGAIRSTILHFKDLWFIIPLVATISLIFAEFFGKYLNEKKLNGYLQTRITIFEMRSLYAFPTAILVVLIPTVLISFASLRIDVWFDLYSSVCTYCISTTFCEESDLLAGKFLIMLIALAILAASFSWVNYPMNQNGTGIGSIFSLQRAYTLKRIDDTFSSWRDKLIRYWEDDKEQLATYRLQKILRNALWHDSLGFIPAYSLTLGLIVCIGVIKSAESSFLFDKSPLFNSALTVILFTAFFDYVENAVHFHHVRNMVEKSYSSLFVYIGVFATLLKFIGLVIMLVVAAITIFTTGLQLYTNPPGNAIWRFAVFIIDGILVAISLALLVLLMKYLGKLFLCLIRKVLVI